jgi:RNA polymerase sigma-70 factor (ECF subfamily)
MHAETESLNALVMQAQRGDAFAIERLLQNSYPKLLRLARSIVRSDDVARDVVQDTMLAVTMNVAGLQNPGAYDIWAGQILRRCCFSHFRRRRRERHVTSDVEACAAVELVADSDEPDPVARAELLAAVELLGGKSREVVSLHYFLGLSIKEIAAAVDTSIGAVKLRLHRARIELRNRLADPARLAISEPGTSCYS